ncbi:MULTISPECIES: IS1595 family transposase [unclassified Roseibium]|uniref:IS1595 family transposase n=1 Tax=unclassified Roseibium TaxID=2629323 RepID=UPI00273F388D|nr:MULTISPECIES: IS1595 family transposase [unclassified Roseibium]
MAKNRKMREDSQEWLERTYPTEASVRSLFERLVWPNGAHCPHCGSLDVWRFRNTGRSSRDGLFECRNCRGQFTVTTKTPMHATKLPLRTWLKALYVTLISSKGISSVILAKQIGVRQPTAWKMAHAIRELMDDRDGRDSLLDGIVEVDTTYMGGRPRKNVDTRYKYVYRPRGKATKRPEVAVAAERGGRVKAAFLSSSANSEQIGRFMGRFISPDAHIMSDDDKAIGKAARAFKDHDTVTHGKKKYVRGNVHSNTVEGIAALLKRTQLGVYHQLSKRHLQRYIDEIVFRKNQRRTIETVNQRDGTVQVQFYHRPFIDQLEELLARAVWRQVRRSGNYGLDWPEPIAPGYIAAPSFAAH